MTSLNLDKPHILAGNNEDSELENELRISSICNINNSSGKVPISDFFPSYKQKKEEALCLCVTRRSHSPKTAKTIRQPLIAFFHVSPPKRVLIKQADNRSREKNPGKKKGIKTGLLSFRSIDLKLKKAAAPGTKLNIFFGKPST